MATRFRASLLGILLLAGIGLQGLVQPQAPSAPAAPTVLNENFDSFSGALADGWVIVNASDPINPDTTEHDRWKQGRSNGFTNMGSHSGAANSFAGSAWEAATSDSDAIVSNWLLTPPLWLENGKTVSFWSRSVGCTGGPDRLDIRYSLAGTSTNVASGNNTGDFSNLLGRINPDLEFGNDPDGSDGYPCNDWAEFSYTISGLNQPMIGRIGFRHHVVNTITRGLYLGIDDFSYSGNVAGGDTPTPITHTPTPSNTATATTTATSTATNTPTNTATNTPTNTATNTPTNTQTPTGTPPTITPSHTPTNTPTRTPTNTPTNTPTITPSRTPEIPVFKVFMAPIQKDA
ncbi:choice-of-anchor J domain-containing protein [Herpetosiphon sp. NSE202]|uniref:choice-of-anchor J domain-containing protein n=1 Tax=Herpetosiphon sp. NSE202 TaxID=3351349 RepID=UPI0036254B9A